MTSRQLIRRATIIEAVIDLIAEVGADAVQMRDVSKRSDVALATVYRYFNSKDYLLAAALEDWQKRLTRRIIASRAGRADQDPLPGILDYLRRAQRAFHRNPNMTALMFQTTTSTDPQARADRRPDESHKHRDVQPAAGRCCAGGYSEHHLWTQRRLSSSLAGVLAGMMTLEESLSRVEWLARVLLAERHAVATLT